MKRMIFLFAVVVSLGATAFAETLVFGLADVELEATLNELNVTATGDVAGFSAEITLSWGIPAVQVTAAFSSGLQPAEIYLAASLAQASGKTLDVVVVAYQKNKKAGWGALAKSLGIKPGSAAFKALKEKSKASAAKRKGKKK